MANSKRHKNPVSDWANAILAELRGPEIPPDAKTARDYMRETGAKRTRVRERLNRAVYNGEMFRADRIVNGKITAYYWPANR